MLSLDEYAASYRPAGKPHYGMGGRQPAMGFLGLDPNRKYVRHDPDDWSTRRMPPMSGEMPRTIASMSIMLTMLRHADRIKIGCATGGLGDLCRTSREDAWKGASHYPFTQLIRYAKGVSLLPEVECDTYHVDGYVIDDMNQYGDFDNVAYVHAAAALNEEAGELSVFVINADWEDEQDFTMDLRGFGDLQLLEHSVLHTDDLDAMNTAQNPGAILPTQGSATLDKGVVSATLPKLSWNLFRFKK